MTPIITKELMDRLSQYNSVRAWLRNKDPGTQQVYLRFLARLTMQTEDTPDGLLRLVKRNEPKALAELIDDFAAEYPYDQMTSCKSAIRGFFLTNGCSLPSKTLGTRTIGHPPKEIKRAA